jgi:uncharacterized protein with NRDE domain
MCLIVVAFGIGRRCPLLVAANRDELHARPTARASWWTEPPGIFGGRDLTAGGTWLAVDRRGRFAAVTNIRDSERRAGLRSRGALVTKFLAGSEQGERYAARAVESGADYGPFNLLVYDGRALHFASNRSPAAALGAGLHAYSNAPAGEKWPKTETARAGVERVLTRHSSIEPLFDLLAERDGVGLPEDVYRRAHFVVGPVYGTRCSTVLHLDDAGRLTFAERSFDVDGRLAGEVSETFALTR